MTSDNTQREVTAHAARGLSGDGEAQGVWQPIGTAPKDGTPIECAWQGEHLVTLYGVHAWRESQRHPGLYGWFFFCTERFHKPTLWRPLTDPFEIGPHLPDTAERGEAPSPPPTDTEEK